MASQGSELNRLRGEVVGREGGPGGGGGTAS